jgi:cytochrome c oxidase subunit III
MQLDAHGHAVAGPGQPPLAHHFGSFAVQTYAARFGMWIFLATEILLFSGLFLGYIVYRYLYPESFALASRQLDLTLGTINTVVLISSSFTVAMAIHFARINQKNLATLMLLLSLLAAVAFLGIKAVEYQHKFHEGLLPGRHFTFDKADLGSGGPMFFVVYFLTTGLHAFHVIIGMGVLAWVMIMNMQGRFSSAYYTPVELGGLYWHLVDLIWIFLYPLLYLV